MIEKIAGINSLKNLKILSLGRNYIKNFSGLVITVLSFLLISFINTEVQEQSNRFLHGDRR